MGRGRGLYVTATAAPLRNSFNRLCPRQISRHSTWTGCKPRNRNLRKPRRSTGVLLHLLGHRLDLAFVIGLLSNVGCYYYLRLIVNCCLAVVALLERLRRAIAHYSRVRIGEIALRCLLGLWPLVLR